MSAVPDYVFDDERLAALDAYAILDTAPEQGFDDIVQLAMLISDAPVALVSLVAKDRQWFKAREGFEPCQTDLNSSVCAHALVEPDLLVISDLSTDPRTCDNPLVIASPHIRFYAGAPLRTAEGHAIGSLCIIDSKPRPEGLTAGQTVGLRSLARQVMTQLELRKTLARQQLFLVEEAEALARRTSLLALGDRLRDITTTRDMAREAAEIVGKTLGASRAGFGLLSDDGELVDIETDWVAPGMTSVAGRHRLADYGELADDLRAGRTIIIEDVRTDPRTSRNPAPLLDLGVRSMLNMVVLERGCPVALFFVHASEPGIWRDEVIAFLRNAVDRVENAVSRIKAEDHQRVLNHELSHRMKNTLAMVQAIAGQTLKGAGDREAVKAFSSRLQALSAAHEVLLQRSWLSAEMGEIVRNVLQMAAAPGSFVVGGPALMIGPRATLSLSLLLHELATNALKYGSLSVDAGVVHVDWRIDRATDEAVLSWRESGGPPVTPPARRGFGTRLIGMGLVGTGGVNVRYLASGLEGEFRAPLLEIQRT